MTVIKGTEQEKVVKIIKDALSAMRNFELLDETLDDGERLELSKGNDQIEQALKSYAERNEICIKHNEGFVTSSTDGKYCMSCRRES